jgi:hypothetical protein
LIFKIIFVAALLIIAMQLVPYGKDHSNPPVSGEPAWDSPETRKLFYQTCGDCHSHNTRWPWYSHVAPISWLVQHDVEEAREHFNVSMWGFQKRNEGDEASEELEKGEMPPWFYLIPHPEANLSQEEKKKLIKGLIATFAGEGG